MRSSLNNVSGSGGYGQTNSVADPYSLARKSLSVAAQRPIVHRDLLTHNEKSHLNIRDNVDPLILMKQEIELHPTVASSRIVPLTDKKIELAQSSSIFAKLSASSPLKNSNRSNKRNAATLKRPCNCMRSMCLKLYCECFAAGEFCLNCNCKDCHNNLDYESDRSAAIRSSLERNPRAFKPKIGITMKPGRTSDMERLHQKGCHCKRSGCLKNYCECFEAKVPCTDRCKCQGCKNTEDQPHIIRDKLGSNVVKGLAQMAKVASADAVRAEYNSRMRKAAGFDATDDDTYDESAMNESQLTSTFFSSSQRGGDIEFKGISNRPVVNPKSRPWYFLTDEVIEGIALCLVLKAKEKEQELSELPFSSATSEAERLNLINGELEKIVLNEFGFCLQRLVDSASLCNNNSNQQQQISFPPTAHCAPSSSSTRQQ